MDKGLVVKVEYWRKERSLGWKKKGQVVRMEHWRKDMW